MSFSTACSLIPSSSNIYRTSLTSFYGLRRSEVLGLKWDAFDFENKTITIRHKAIETKKK